MKIVKLILLIIAVFLTVYYNFNYANYKSIKLDYNDDYKIEEKRIADKLAELKKIIEKKKKIKKYRKTKEEIFRLNKIKREEAEYFILDSYKDKFFVYQ
jgi:hypothetical protein